MITNSTIVYDSKKLDENRFFYQISNSVFYLCQLQEEKINKKDLQRKNNKEKVFSLNYLIGNFKKILFYYDSNKIAIKLSISFQQSVGDLSLYNLNISNDPDNKNKLEKDFRAFVLNIFNADKNYLLSENLNVFFNNCLKVIQNIKNFEFTLYKNLLIAIILLIIENITDTICVFNTEKENFIFNYKEKELILELSSFLNYFFDFSKDFDKIEKKIFFFLENNFLPKILFPISEDSISINIQSYPEMIIFPSIDTNVFQQHIEKENGKKLIKKNNNFNNLFLKETYFLNKLNNIKILFILFVFVFIFLMSKNIFSNNNQEL